MSDALLVVDVQRAFDESAYWGRRNNPACEENVARLIAAWRAAGDPIVFVRHDSVDPGSPLAPGTPGNAFKDVVTGTVTADELQRATAASLHGEFARVLTTRDVL